MENNKNLLVETLNLLQKNERNWEDVTDVFISGKYNIGKDNFYKLASSANYVESRDDINIGLIIKGKDFFFNVENYDSYLTYLHFIDLKIPENIVEDPKIFTMFDHEYIGD